jgi:hypothetical protein
MDARTLLETGKSALSEQIVTEMVGGLKQE